MEGQGTTRRPLIPGTAQATLDPADGQLHVGPSGSPGTLQLLHPPCLHGSPPLRAPPLSLRAGVSSGNDHCPPLQEVPIVTPVTSPPTSTPSHSPAWAQRRAPKHPQAWAGLALPPSSPGTWLSHDQP